MVDGYDVGDGPDRHEIEQLGEPRFGPVRKPVVRRSSVRRVRSR